ncbi:MAG TPA: HAMP domain-containing sensor histidine kinase [Gaiellaceae bacterium]
MSRLSLRTRLLLGVVLLAALGLVAADVATYRELRSFLVSQMDTTLQQEHQAFEGGDDEHVPPEVFFERRSADGKTVVSPLSVSLFPDQARPPAPLLPQTIHVPARPNEGFDRASYFTVGSHGGEEYRVRAAIEPELDGSMLIVAQSLHDVNRTLHRLFFVELTVTLVVLGALAALALWIIRISLRPLRRIEETAAAITAGDLSRRVEHADPQTEVGRVGSALNTMLDRIEASDRRLRRFIADASHELRTPLAAVRAYAELFGRGAAARPADLERSMSGISRETERMSLLVDDLLLLSRLDEGRPLERAPVDLAAIVEEAVDASRVVEPGRPIELFVEPAMVAGDEARLHQVLDNLLANARAHTPPGTSVSVELRRVDGRAELTVVDRGPGLTEEQVERVFERFYRADSSRTRASGGAGLGLSIVAAVTEAHGGTAEARPTPGGGATFVITLPLDAG